MKLISTVVAILWSGLTFSSPLEIIKNTNGINFKNIVTSRSTANAIKRPLTKHESFIFKVKGEPGKTFQVSLPNKQHSNLNENNLHFLNFTFGCALSNLGISTIQPNGYSKELCIGAKITTKSRLSPGNYNNHIYIKVTYL